VEENDEEKLMNLKKRNSERAREEEG